MERPKALLLGLDLHQLGVARSLGRRGIIVDGIDSEHYPIGNLSRYCRRIRAPKLNEEDKLLDFLLDYGKNLKNKPIIFSGDRYTFFIMRYREKIETLFEIPLPPNDVLNKILDKRKLYKSMMTDGIPIPTTFFPECEDDLIEISKKIAFPCILKPSNSVNFYKHFRLKVLEANNLAELIDGFHMMRKEGEEVIVQEIIPGGDDRLYTMGSYLDESSNVIAVFSGRKLRQYPIRYGLCSLGESVYEPEVVELGTRLLQGMGYHGISQVEFKKDERDDKFKLIEINARTWTWHMLATACGVDLSYVAYCDKAGLGLPAIRTPHIEGLKWICVFTDLISASKYLCNGELSIKEWIKSLRGKKKFALWACDDPMPVAGLFLVSIKHIFQKRTK
jgi:predicted ATP-grasp superfamily ATP-dependent carboligase